MSKYLITNEQQVRDTFTKYTKDLDPRVNEWYQKVFYRHLLRNAHLKPVEHGSSFNHSIARLERYPKQYFDDRPHITKALEDAVDVLRALTPTVFNHEYGKAWSSLTPTQVKAITEMNMIPVQMEAFVHHPNGSYPTGKDRYVMLARLEMAKDSLPKFFKQLNDVLVSLLDGDKSLNSFNVESVLDHLASMIRTKHIDELTVAGHAGPNAKVIYTHSEYEFVHLSSLDAVGCAGMQLSNCLRDSTQHYFNKGMVIGLRKISTRMFTSAFTLVKQSSTPTTAPKYINELESVFEGFARNIVTAEERQAVVDYVTENGWHSLVTGEVGVNMALVEDRNVEAKHRNAARERQDVLLKQHSAEVEARKHLLRNWVPYYELQLSTITDTTGRYSLRSQMFNRIRPQPVITPVRTNADGTPTATPRRTLVNYPIQTYAAVMRTVSESVALAPIEPQAPVPVPPVSDVAVLEVRPDYGINITDLLESATAQEENVSQDVVAQTNNGPVELTVTGPRHLMARIQEAVQPQAPSMAARVGDIPRSSMGIMEMSWMPGDDSQRESRLHRAGRVSTNPAIFGMMYGMHGAGHMRRYLEKRDAIVTREQIAAVVKLQREFAKPDTSPKHILLKLPKPMTHASEYIAATLHWDQQVRMRESVRQTIERAEFGEIHGMTILSTAYEAAEIFGRPDFGFLDSISATTPMIVDPIRVAPRVHDSEVSIAPVGGKTALASELARKMGLKTIEVRPRSRGPQSRNFWQR